MIAKEQIKFPFSNNLIFAAVMQNEVRCRKFLERILPERKIRQLRFPSEHELGGEISTGSNVFSEAQISQDPDHKSVQLDVLFEGDDSWYDIEMQVENVDNIPKRSRYYHSMIDSFILEKGEKYNNLKSCYVIFICCFDLFGRGEPVYSFRRIDEKNGLRLDDDAFTIILNSRCAPEKVPAELVNLFAYINEGVLPEEPDELIDDIHQRVLELNNRKEMEKVISAARQLEWMEEDIIKLKKTRDEMQKSLDRMKASRDEMKASRDEMKASRDETVRKMKEAGITLELIMQCTGLDEEEIHRL